MPRGVYDRKNSAVKKSPKAKKTVETLETLNEHPTVIQLDELSLLQLTKLDAEMRAAQSELLVQKGIKEGIMLKIDPQGVLKSLDTKIQGLTAKYHEVSNNYSAMRERLGKELGIDMKNYAYDDETGILRDITVAPPQVEPAKETVPTQRAN